MLLAEMSGGEWIAIIAAVGAQIATIVGVILGYLKSAGNADRIETVARVADATHTLVNSNMGVALREKAIFARRVADLTKDAADQILATAAEKLLADHEAKQAKVDKGETTPLEPPAPELH